MTTGQVSEQHQSVESIAHRTSRVSQHIEKSHVKERV